ncbi:MAG: class-II fumarase/aspartase family protein [Candidatus Electronema sp. V4]|uniref:class-II fumarase/aspartase family protein n=1 Tax=Candidatus Electronema sp. V4 TaxID=3454756 RepID=UPI0040555EED
MPVHPFDYQINPHVFSTPELEALFDERTVLQRWLDFEAALAEAQGRRGLIPAAAAAEIKSKARLELLDLDSIRQGYGKSRNSVVPLLGGLRRACADGAGEYVHYGATTQDVLDTGQVLALKETLAIILRDLLRLEEVCLDLAVKHRATPMAARTHGQQALPTAFGLKVAVWAAEIRRHIQRLRHLQSTVCCGQLSGAVGTYAALGEQGIEVAKETMELLGLTHDPLSWHTARDRIAELASDFALLAMTLAKIANEIYQLQKTELDELREPPPSGAPASSTMPHKQNPVLCQRIVALSRHVRALSGTVIESMAHEHERDPRCLWAEWLAMPQICIYTGASASSLLQILSGLIVRPEQMLANLHRQKDLIATEWLLFRLGKIVGKNKAMDKLHALAAAAAEQRISLKAAVLADTELGALFTAEELAPLDSPEQYVGSAVELVDRTVEEISGLMRNNN